MISVEGDMVTFLWRDYAHGNKQSEMTVKATEFLRRYFLHVLPKGFVRIRFFGFLANRQRPRLLPTCRTLLAGNGDPAPLSRSRGEEAGTDDQSTQLPQCPLCHRGLLHRIERLPPQWRMLTIVPTIAADSS
jgi:hypothetical protein